MDLNYIALAIPVFLVLIGVELAFARHEQKEFYRFNDTINDLSCGIAQQVVGIFSKVLIFAGYLWIYENFRLLEISTKSVAAWIVLLFGVDLCYYWFHRVSHRMNAPWAAHIVHHQSEDYNLAVALRQGTFQSWFSWIFYLPLAIVGFPPPMFLAMSAFDTLYQFWIHTRAIDKLGPLEWFMNTPSHHRVHHGRNPKYLDKNYAGIFIIWDRLFGTFEPEVDPVVYGVTEPLNSWNPIWANFHYWAKLKSLAQTFPRTIDRVKLFFMPPGWQPAGMAPLPPHPEVKPETYVKYETLVPTSLKLYVLVQFAPVIAATFIILQMEKIWSRPTLASVAGLIVLAILTLGGLLDKRGWAFNGEIVRLIVQAASATYVLRANTGFIIFLTAIIFLTSVFIYWLLHYRGLFRRRSFEFQMR
jgi:sterol desaturase/sphingolipid hydroxylase (fatty acid hydroxylase superfamily)